MHLRPIMARFCIAAVALATAVYNTNGFASPSMLVNNNKAAFTTGHIIHTNAPPFYTATVDTADLTSEGAKQQVGNEAFLNENLM